VQGSCTLSPGGCPNAGIPTGRCTRPGAPARRRRRGYRESARFPFHNRHNRTVGDKMRVEGQGKFSTRFRGQSRPGITSPSRCGNVEAASAWFSFFVSPARRRWASLWSASLSGPFVLRGEVLGVDGMQNPERPVATPERHQVLRYTVNAVLKGACDGDLS
jgi:hypothetical protein